jgi:hypothetical protein
MTHQFPWNDDHADHAVPDYVHLREERSLEQGESHFSPD